MENGTKITGKETEKIKTDQGTKNTEEEIAEWLRLVHEGPCCSHPSDEEIEKNSKKNK
jgi:hypothetical protein